MTEAELPPTKAPELPEKLDLRSHDLAEDKRQELLRLFPEVRTEGGKIDFERLKRVLGETVDTGKERYGLTWPGKADCFKTIQAPSLGTLRPCREESVDFDTTQNLIIEGDNLEVLKLLQKSYLGKVKMIYIDPPYNTGKDFIYPDNFSESLQTYLEYTGQVDAEGRKFGTNTEADGRFHSKWMNMMYPRLFLARNLLREDGVLFVSIDDAEAPNLRHLLNELFGEENFVSNVVWNHTRQSKNDERYFSRHHNQILVYRRSDQLPGFAFERTEEDDAAYGNPDDDPRGPWRSGDVRSPNPRQTLRYQVKTPSGKVIESPENGWRWSEQTLLHKISEGEIIFSANEDRVVRKIYLSEQEGRTPENLWLADVAGTTRMANSELKELFEHPPFDTPKPTLLLRRMLMLGARGTDDIVLDFFGGSGSTAHAVMDANEEDGGRRKFILVQLPEATGREDFATIADVTKERVRRVIKKLNTDDSGKLALDGSKNPVRGFRVYKLAESNFNPWNAEVSHATDAVAKQLDLHIDHIRPGRTADDLLSEILLKSGYPLTTPVETLQLAGKSVHSVAAGALLVCLERELSLELIRAMAEKKPTRVVCLDEGFAGNDQLKANAVQIFRTKGVTSFKTV